MPEGHTQRLEAALSGRYRIGRKLGEGGMASVYLAEDVKHERNVAVKVLRPELAAVIGAERFLAEIKTTANLQHPHILPLFDSGEADGYLYYVMPYVDGETLAERLRRERQLGIDEAVRITREVADALEHAHRAGVIHRDIKPGNILLQSGRPVVADFGIALAVSEAGGGRMTETGLSLGTPHYMSPEQASADRDLSARSDLYSLGCVLYEMIAGQPPHTGPSAQRILVQILTETPTDLTELRHTVPTNVAAAVAKAIEKLPADRFESAADFSAALGNEAFRYDAGSGRRGVGWGAADPPGRGPRPEAWLARGASKAAVATVAVLSVGLVAVLASVRRGSSVSPYPPAVVRFQLDSSWADAIAGSIEWAITDDGSAVAYGTGAGPITYVRLDGSVRRRLAGTENAQSIVFSPDGAWLMYFGAPDGAGMYRVSVEGGSPIRINLGTPFGLPSDWAPDGWVYYQTLEGMYRVREGDVPERLLDEGFLVSRFARVLPGGKALIYTHGTLSSDATEIRLLDLETREVRTLIEDGFDAQYVASGHLVYGRFDRSAVVVPFDPATRSVGHAVALMDSLWIQRASGLLGLRVAESGTAIYARGGIRSDAGGQRRRLARVTMEGRVSLEPLPAGPLGDLSISPDGRSVAYQRESNIHVYDLVTGAPRRFSQRLGLGNPQWSRDGTEISYLSLGGGGGIAAAAIGPADGSGTHETIPTDRVVADVSDFSPDGTRLLATVVSNAELQNSDIYVMDKDGSNPRPYLQAAWSESGGKISADGRWVAYVSEESGSEAVYLRSFPEPGLPLRVSSGEGRYPRWGRDRATLYYQTADSLFEVRLSLGDEPSVTGRRAVFSRERAEGRLLSWDVHPNGGFVAAIEPPAPEGEGRGAAEDSPPRGYVVVNWVEEMVRRLGGE